MILRFPVWAEIRTNQGGLAYEFDFLHRFNACGKRWPLGIFAPARQLKLSLFHCGVNRIGSRMAQVKLIHGHSAA